MTNQISLFLSSLSKGPSIYYVSKMTGCVAIQNGKFCIYADIVDGRVRKVHIERNVWIVPK